MYLSKECIIKNTENIFEQFKNIIKPSGLTNKFGCVMWKYSQDLLTKCSTLTDYLNKIQTFIINKILSFGISDIDIELQEGVKNLIKDIIKREKFLIDIFESNKKPPKKNNSTKKREKTLKASSSIKSTTSINSSLTKRKSLNSNFQFQKEIKKKNFTQKVSQKKFDISQKVDSLDSASIEDVSEFFEKRNKKSPKPSKPPIIKLNKKSISQKSDSNSHLNVNIKQCLKSSSESENKHVKVSNDSNESGNVIAIKDFALSSESVSLKLQENDIFSVNKKKLTPSKQIILAKDKESDVIYLIVREEPHKNDLHFQINII